MLTASVRVEPKVPRVVRFAFMDEAGISANEPTVVVAAVFVHGDKQLVPLENELNALVRKYILADRRQGFRFHATDVFSGTGKIFADRNEWPRDRRYALLRELARIPVRLDLPIVYRSVNREDVLSDSDNLNRHEKILLPHAVAFITCTLEIELFMRSVFPAEIVQLVAEDNNEIRSRLKKTHAALRDPNGFQKTAEGRYLHGLLPFSHMRSAIHFANKDESSPLQIADVCAFLIRGHLTNHPENPQFYKHIRRMLAIIPKDEILPVFRGVSASPPYTIISSEDDEVTV